jgi:hypothetical protein
MEHSSRKNSRSASSSHWNRSKDARLRSGDVPFTRIDVSVDDKDPSFHVVVADDNDVDEDESVNPAENDDGDDEVDGSWSRCSHLRVGLLDTVTVMGYLPVTKRCRSLVRDRMDWWNLDRPSSPPPDEEEYGRRFGSICCAN